MPPTPIQEPKTLDPDAPDPCSAQAPLEEVQSYAEYRFVMDVVLKALNENAFQCRQLGNLAWAIATLGADEPEVRISVYM